MSDAGAIISRLKKATGPDQELDDTIAVLEGYRGSPLPYTHYTSSIDAALTLVPEGLSCAVKIYPEGGGACEIWRYVTEVFAEAYGGAEELRRRNGTFDHQNVGAATPAIAICIAALKARTAALTQPTDRSAAE